MSTISAIYRSFLLKKMIFN